VTDPAPINTDAAQPRKRQLSKVKFPTYSLLDSVKVAHTVHDRGGGVVSNDQLAAYLGYRSAKNGAYLARISAARIFGLITGQGDSITITPRAQTILLPERPEHARKALVEAFLAVPLFRQVYDDNHGSEIPSEFGLKNAFRTRYGMTPSRVDEAYRALIDSAEQAGFFSSKGSRTQLIIPNVGATSPTQPAAPKPQSNGGSGDGGDGPKDQTPPPAPQTKADLQTQYVSTLIELLRQKGEPDPDLMQKIEELLEIKRS
jgi:hypothetical protein